VRESREAGGAIANEQHLWSTPVLHLSRRSGAIKGERRSGWSREEQACFCLYILFGKPAVVREGLLAGNLFVYFV